MKDIKLFLKESNKIEEVYDEDSLRQAIYAWEFITKEGLLTVGNILKTHKILMLHQKLLPNEKGYFRQKRVYIGGHKAKPWYSVPLLICQWLEKANWVKSWVQIKKQHIEFESIHPFIDGNGRIGRIFMNWQRVKIGKPILVILEKDKQKYYDWF